MTKRKSIGLRPASRRPSASSAHAQRWQQAPSQARQAQPAAGPPTHLPPASFGVAPPPIPPARPTPPAKVARGTGDHHTRPPMTMEVKDWALESVRSSREVLVPAQPVATRAPAVPVASSPPPQAVPGYPMRPTRTEHVSPLPYGSAAPASFASPTLQSSGQVIVVFGCRGGSGATTIAVNTAAQLARAGKQVCLLDMDLQLGDVFVALNLPPTTSIAALARDIATLDGPAVKRRMIRHDSGVYALGQSGRLDDLGHDLMALLPELLRQLRRHFEYVVVDGIRDFGDAALPVIDCADSLALVATQDVPAIRRAARVITLFRRLGLDDKKLRLVINRWQHKGLIDAAEIERALGVPIRASVRNDFARASAALDRGGLLVDFARPKMQRELAALANVLVAPSRPTPHTLEGSHAIR